MNNPCAMQCLVRLKYANLLDGADPKDKANGRCEINEQKKI